MQKRRTTKDIIPKVSVKIKLDRRQRALSYEDQPIDLIIKTLQDIAKKYQ